MRSIPIALLSSTDASASLTSWVVKVKVLKLELVNDGSLWRSDDGIEEVEQNSE